jgi:hypothetical protein
LDLDQKQLSDWLAFYGHCPWGEDVDDVRHGINTAAIANMLRGKGGRAMKPQDFMVHKPEKPKQTWQDMKKEARRIALLTGGTIIKKKTQGPSCNLRTQRDGEA